MLIRLAAISCAKPADVQGHADGISRVGGKGREKSAARLQFADEAPSPRLAISALARRAQGRGRADRAKLDPARFEVGHDLQHGGASQRMRGPVAKKMSAAPAHQARLR